MDIWYFNAYGERTYDPDLVVFIAVPCQCSPPIYLQTAVEDVVNTNPVIFTRPWNKNMAAPTIDGSFDPPGCPCHFSIEDGRYK